MSRRNKSEPVPESILKRLRAVGFSNAFIRTALLPSWWDASCDRDPTLLFEVEFRVARFLNIPVEAVRSGEAAFATSGSARLRHTANLNAAKLQPTVHAAIEVGGAVLRSLRTDLQVPELPSDPVRWREDMLKRTKLELEPIVEELWDRGIPVIHLSFPKMLKFQGIATIINGRPLAALGTDIDVPARQAFFLLHEIGHLANGDCNEGVTIVDEEETGGKFDEKERLADQFAIRFLHANSLPLTGRFTSGRLLAEAAYDAADKNRTEPGAVIWRWANGPNGDFSIATSALDALYCSTGARRALRKAFDERVDVLNASETDRGLLGCVAGGALDADSAPD